MKTPPHPDYAAALRELAIKERDLETLRALLSATENAMEFGIRNRSTQGWVMPMDCGGYNGSHHSYTLTKLAKRGLCDRLKFGGKNEKGSCRYRINDAGRKFLAEAKLKSRG